MSLDLTETDMRDFAEAEEVQAFFGRSIVTTCYFGVVTHTVLPWFPEVLRKLPHLRMLCLQRLSFLDNYPNAHNKEYMAPHVYPRLRELCMIDCGLNLGALKQLLGANSVKVLRLESCAVNSREQLNLEVKVLEVELSKLVPNVRCYTDEDCVTDPYLNWDFVYF
ncbi:hypothetical protein FRC09_013733 [Ceratobasidium sp. 395]|nr:hypothetical protein FRC09_013733 [Ceratobasidium sp. 395]